MEPTPQATMRLQMNRDFDFDAARAQVPYLNRLGISHLYLSPIHVARAGSMHGYDVVDYSAVNPELGGEDALRTLVAELRRYHMGLIVDLVPNHMAIAGHDNHAWLDLLEWGMQSHYADFFDVDWEVPDPALRHRVHTPFLGKPYGQALDDGDLSLHFDPHQARFYVAYYEHHFPIAPRHYAEILGDWDPLLEAHAGNFRAATANKGRRENRVEEARQALREAIQGDPGVLHRIEDRLEDYDCASHRGRHLLHRLLEHQNYRLAWWRSASDEINWRRFFDILELAGLRMQDLPAFSIVHNTTFRLYSDGLIDGVRIDHIDGLADPRTYCRRLRRALSKLNHKRPPGVPQGKPIIYVEKILAPSERLSKEWQVDGDTGYAFMNDIGALLHHPGGEEPLGRAWTALTGRPHDFELEEKDARRRTLETSLAADFNACALALHRIARQDSHTRDWTLAAIRRVLMEVLVEFPVYRTYMDARGRSAEDEALMTSTLAAAARQCLPHDRELLELLDRWLGGEPPLSVRPARARRSRLRAIARFQQLSSPVAAKSVEDTAFYRYGHLLSRNEVGSTPLQFSMSAREFHGSCRSRLRRYPRCMLATATHDHKRGEDLRARLAVLSEVPEHWLMNVGNWRQANRPLKPLDEEGQEAPDAADEYMLYQMLAGAWPLELEVEDREALARFAERIGEWQLKALREAKRNSSWVDTNLDYEQRAAAFLEATMDPDRSGEFLRQLQAFVASVAVPGVLNSLSQVAVKVCSPGIPDVYQGCDLWDFSFVDPDNRRPVDYRLRHALLERSDHHTLLTEWRSGRLKQYLLASLLNLRNRRPGLFAHGNYQPLRVQGDEEAHVFCFAREYRGQALILACTRHTAELCEPDLPRIRSEHWRDTRIQLPKPLREQGWRDLLTDSRYRGDFLPLTQLFAEFTVAVLLNTEASGESLQNSS